MAATPSLLRVRTTRIPRCSQGGFTLIELMIVAAIAAVLAMIAAEGYASYMEDARNRDALADMKRIETMIERYRSDSGGALPDTLADLGGSVPRDRWGNPYGYLNLESDDPSVKGKARKDKNLVPINSDFDLYSAGADGDSKPPLTAKPSRDDLVRANNGGFYGIAEDY